MKLFTIQPKSVLNEINKKGFYTCDIKKSSTVDLTDENKSYNKFYNAYKYLVSKMNEKIENKENIEFPVWAWYKYKDYTFNDFASYENGEDIYFIEIEIDDDKVLLTDHSDWHAVLNDYPIIDENKDFDKEWERLNSLSSSNLKKEKLSSWEKIFLDKDSKNNYIQATFFILKKENIKNVIQIKKTIDTMGLESLADDLKEYNNLSFYKITKEDIPSVLENYKENAYNTYKYKNNLSDFELLEKQVLSDKEKDIIEKIEKHFAIENEISK